MALPPVPQSISGTVLPPGLVSAVEDFRRFCAAYMLEEQKAGTPQIPLYHYTDERGLEGIIRSQSLWFSDYRYMNDPMELKHGLELARKTTAILAARAERPIKLFLDTLADMMSVEKVWETLEFFIVSLTEKRDDLGQWRAYGDNGKGYAIGFAPHLFAIEPDLPPVHERCFVGRVHYKNADVRGRNKIILKEAASIIRGLIVEHPDIFQTKNLNIYFLREMVQQTLACALIWNFITSKHPEYFYEHERRLIKLGTPDHLKPHVKTRDRGADKIRYIPHNWPLTGKKAITEIVVGPANGTYQEDTVRAILADIGADPHTPINRSKVPYRS